MMREKPRPELGRLCLSKAGHDAGRYYIIVAFAEDEDYVLIADGKLRRIEKPKKKKLKHLHMTPIVLDEAARRLKSAQDLSNGELYNMITKTERHA